METNPFSSKDSRFRSKKFDSKSDFRASKQSIKKPSNALKEAKEHGKNVFLVQRYLTNPLLYKNRKFDIRCYVLMVRYNSQIFAYFFKQGYARTSSYDYSINTEDNLLVHLTNEAVQIKGESTKLLKIFEIYVFRNGQFWQVRKRK